MTMGELTTVDDTFDNPDLLPEALGGDLEETLAYRERYVIDEMLEREGLLEPESAADPRVAALNDDDVRNLVGPKALDLIVRYETGGKGYYEKVYKSAPVWPGYSSGLTIGFGFDLGYNTKTQFSEAWGGHIPDRDIDRLAASILLKATSPGRSAKVTRLRQFVRRFSDVRIPWGVAEEVFELTTLPKYTRKALKYLPNMLDMPPDCRGVLCSIVFNRGASFNRSGNRFREMRAIKALVHEGRFDKIPAQIRAMKRIWGASSGLGKRREAEARLFEEAWARRHEDTQTPIPGTTPAGGSDQVVQAGGGTATGGGTIPDPYTFDPCPVLQGESLATLAPEILHGDTGEPFSEEHDHYAFEAQLDELEDMLEAESAGGVRWANSDEFTIDYRHLDSQWAGQAFNFRVEDLELLIDANGFKPVTDNGKILFGLRGCELIGHPAQHNKTELHLRDVRPDHVNFRCVLGVFDLADRTLSAFVGSTVPHAKAVRACYRQHKSGRPKHKCSGNMLPTGCYPYVVGTHYGSKPTHGALLQGYSFNKRAKVVVLRSVNDLVYGTRDFWHHCEPRDNIHPAFSTRTFSSFGCQTVRGTYRGGRHTGEWSEYRDAIGLGAPGAKDNGKRYDYVLLTGLDAAVASKLREEQYLSDEIIVREELYRLRHGSEGERVHELQMALRVEQTGFLGPTTRLRLTDCQSHRLGYADGIYSPEMDGLMGLRIFGGGSV